MSENERIVLTIILCVVGCVLFGILRAVVEIWSDISARKWGDKMYNKNGNIYKRNKKMMDEWWEEQRGESPKIKLSDSEGEEE